MEVVAYAFALFPGFSPEDAQRAGVLAKWGEAQEQRTAAAKAWICTHMEVLQTRQIRSSLALLAPMLRWSRGQRRLPELCVLAILEYAMPAVEDITLPAILHPALVGPSLVHTMFVRGRMGDEIAEMHELQYFLSTVATLHSTLRDRLRRLGEQLGRGAGLSATLLTGIWEADIPIAVAARAQEEEDDDEGDEDEAEGGADDEGGAEVAPDRHAAPNFQPLVDDDI
jgi:hypothetical protein